LYSLGAEAQKLFDEAQAMLKRIVDDKLLKCRGVIGFWVAESIEDDIVVYEEHVSDGAHIAGTFHGLRQQVNHNKVICSSFRCQVIICIYSIM